MRLAYILILFLAPWISACAGQTTSDELELDPTALNAHFADQQKCGRYVESLVRPVVQALRKQSTIQEMRDWLRDHPQENFSKLVLRIQQLTTAEGPIDPRSESDQLRVTQLLWTEMGILPGFDQASCGPDVREAVMESFYLGLGGSKAQVNLQLRRNGVTGAWEQRWVLITALMAGCLDPDSID